MYDTIGTPSDDDYESTETKFAKANVRRFFGTSLVLIVAAGICVYIATGNTWLGLAASAALGSVLTGQCMHGWGVTQDLREHQELVNAIAEDFLRLQQKDTH